MNIGQSGPSAAAQQATAEVARILNVSVDTLSADAGLMSHPRWDSQAHVEIMVWLSEGYAVEFTEESMLRFATLSAIVSFVEAAS